MCLKLASNCIQHDCIFHVFPIGPQRDFSCHTKRLGVLGLSAISDTLTVLLIAELHRLEVVFNGSPPPTIECNAVRRKVGKLGKRVRLRVEVYGVFRLIVHGKITAGTCEDCKQVGLVPALHCIFHQ